MKDMAETKERKKLISDNLVKNLNRITQKKKYKSKKIEERGIHGLSKFPPQEAPRAE